MFLSRGIEKNNIGSKRTLTIAEENKNGMTEVIPFNFIVNISRQAYLQLRAYPYRRCQGHSA